MYPFTLNHYLKNEIIPQLPLDEEVDHNFKVESTSFAEGFGCYGSPVVLQGGTNVGSATSDVL